MPFTSVITTTGLVKIANAIAGDSQILITELAVGDGNGTTPEHEATDTGLVHEVWRDAVDSVQRDPDNPDQVIVTATIPVEEGGFTVREAAIFTADGQMFAATGYPTTYKPSPAEGAATEITLEFAVVINPAATVTVVISPDVVTPISKMLRVPFISIESMTVGTPPSTPEPGAIYIMPASRSGVFLAFPQHFMAQWDGGAWRVANAPEGTVVYNISDQLYYARTSSGWDLFHASATKHGLIRLTQAADIGANDAAKALTPAVLDAALTNVGVSGTAIGTYKGRNSNSYQFRAVEGQNGIAAAASSDGNKVLVGLSNQNGWTLLLRNSAAIGVPAGVGMLELTSEPNVQPTDFVLLGKSGDGALRRATRDAVIGQISGWAIMLRNAASAGVPAGVLMTALTEETNVAVDDYLLLGKHADGALRKATRNSVIGNIPGWSIMLNAGASPAVPQGVKITQLVQESNPSPLDWLMLAKSADGELRKIQAGLFGGLKGLRVFTYTGSVQTWTRPAGCTKVLVIATGGGGRAGDGGLETDVPGTAGDTVFKFLDVTTIASVPVTVGVGGENSTPFLWRGQDTTFGSYCKASGGAGGNFFDGTFFNEGRSVGDLIISAGGPESFWGGHTPNNLGGTYYGAFGTGGSPNTTSTSPGRRGVVVVLEF
ncbi:MAG: phage tail protein [Bacteroidota bacterium]